MIIFSVISPSAELAEKIEHVYSSNNLRVAPNVCFVADSGVTAEEVASKLGVVEGKLSGTIIVRVADYYGYASKTIWEWFRVKDESA